MGVTLEIPAEYGYVVVVLVLYIFFNIWMAFQVGKARREYKVFYPTLYAVESENKDAKLFNCVQVLFIPQLNDWKLPSVARSDALKYFIFCCWLWQRGHQNSLESMPVFFTTLLVGGLQHPVIAAGLGALYTVARFFYFKGYSTGVPENRLKIG
ncbi:microsomal glutathione S-transferase 3 [Canna indica]|uniref:Microsomal glutathione S-transferase 3 n=1 Tax=Canna indica TaxID=4628 RepID=A0AAQ3K9Y9_9LILI|nr:microsomal glutathione S-transferase 3 [Canna indica]